MLERNVQIFARKNQPSEIRRVFVRIGGVDNSGLQKDSVSYIMRKRERKEGKDKQIRGFCRPPHIKNNNEKSVFVYRSNSFRNDSNRHRNTERGKAGMRNVESVGQGV